MLPPELYRRILEPSRLAHRAIYPRVRYMRLIIYRRGIFRARRPKRHPPSNWAVHKRSKSELHLLSSLS